MFILIKNRKSCLDSIWEIHILFTINIIGEIEYNRRIANILMLDHHMLIEDVESIFDYLRVWYPFINDSDINTMQSCYKPVLMTYDNFFNRDSNIQNLKKSTNPHNQ